ncbi:MAG: tetratricopeptide repeat protein [Hyphomicrobiales bacterium]
MKKVLGIAVLFMLPGAAVYAQSESQAPAVTEETLRKPALSAEDKQRVETELLNSLFNRVKEAQDEESAKAVEQAIWQLWLRHPSPSVEVLMGQAVSAMNDSENSKAIRILDRVIAMQPDYAEAWNKRATAHFYQEDYGRSLADIARVLNLEPRHFGALSGLGLVYQALGDKKKALNALREAMKVHPYLEGAKDAEKRLQEEVEGEAI